MLFIQVTFGQNTLQKYNYCWRLFGEWWDLQSVRENIWTSRLQSQTTQQSAVNKRKVSLSSCFVTGPCVIHRVIFFLSWANCFLPLARTCDIEKTPASIEPVNPSLGEKRSKEVIAHISITDCQVETELGEEKISEEEEVKCWFVSVFSFAARSRLTCLSLEEEEDKLSQLAPTTTTASASAAAATCLSCYLRSSSTREVLAVACKYVCVRFQPKRTLADSYVRSTGRKKATVVTRPSLSQFQNHKTPLAEDFYEVHKRIEDFCVTKITKCSVGRRTIPIKLRRKTFKFRFFC